MLEAAKLHKFESNIKFQFVLNIYNQFIYTIDEYTKTNTDDSKAFGFLPRRLEKARR